MVGHLSIPAVPMPTWNNTRELKEELKDSSMLRELGGGQMKPPPPTVGQCPTKGVGVGRWAHPELTGALKEINLGVP